MKRIFNRRNVVVFIFLTFLVSSIYVGISMILAPTVAPVGDCFTRVKGDYVLMLLQCFVGVIGMLLPGILSKRFRIGIPDNMLIMYAIFLFCSIYLGEIQSFYYHVPHWDTILHTFSGAMVGALGFSVISILNKTPHFHLNLSPLFVAVFAFCFAITLGVFWEIYEFSVDIILGTNMQKYALENKELLVGHVALLDTMKDLIVDCLGAFIVSVVGYLSLKHKKNWLESFLLTFDHEDK